MRSGNGTGDSQHRRPTGDSAATDTIVPIGSRRIAAATGGSTRPHRTDASRRWRRAAGRVVPTTGQKTKATRSQTIGTQKASEIAIQSTVVRQSGGT